MKITKFQDFIIEYYMEHNPEGLTKDNIDDRVAEWEGNLEVDDWESLGDLYGQKVELELYEFAEKNRDN